ncbi:ABC transporter substrate-binding protein [Anaerococcus sp. Marseille-P9784]|uniref:ABC transporter substrate-binding protein n=1 Tax=Anaerococcus sp. Marseille-P9784 TaxID=2614127 RepID=UPI00124A6C5F|nr:ABC transporter substrate-binding protein [Anaerococcus sp. Marseille-P9784]
MNKLKSIALLAALTLVFAGCGKNEDAKSNDQATETKQTEAVENKEDNKEAADNEENKDESSKEDDQSQAKEGGLFVLGIGSDPSIVNPLYANDRVSLTLTHILYDNVYNVKKGEIIYDGLAESMTPSDDNLTYTLKLKENLKWHDGEAITADDLIYTYDVVLDEKQQTKGHSDLMNNDKPIAYKKLDDLTVEFKLEKPDATFIQGLAGIVPVPKHIFEGEADLAKSEKNKNPIGSGSFKFKEHKTGELYQVERFDDYHGDVAKLDGIAFKVIPDANAQNLALENGEISASYVKSQNVDKFKDNDKFDLYTFSEGMVDTIFFKVSNPKMQDKNLRQAISYAIDKNKLIQGAYNGEEYATPAYSPFSLETQFVTDDVEKYDYNVEKAKELVKDVKKEDLNLRLMYTSGSPATEKEALLIQEMLKEIGVNLELLPMERATFIEKLLDPKNQDFEMAINGYVMGDNPDSYGYLFKTGSAENFSGYSNEEIDKLFAEGKTEMDEAKRSEIYKKIQQILVDDAVQYSLVNTKSIIAANSEFGNIEEATPAPIYMLQYYNKITKK